MHSYDEASDQSKFSLEVNWNNAFILHMNKFDALGKFLSLPSDIPRSKIYIFSLFMNHVVNKIASRKEHPYPGKVKRFLSDHAFKYFNLCDVLLQTTFASF